MLFGDNEGAVQNFIQMKSTNKFISGVLKVYALMEEKYFPFVWFERVRSASNIADGPSRLVVGDLEDLERVDVCLSLISREIHQAMQDCDTDFLHGGFAGL